MLVHLLSKLGTTRNAVDSHTDLQGLHCAEHVNILQISARELLLRLQFSFGVVVPLDRISIGGYGPHEVHRHFGLLHRVFVSDVGHQRMNFDVGERRTPQSGFVEVASCCAVEEVIDVSLAQVRVMRKFDDGIFLLEAYLLSTMAAVFV